MDFPYGITVTLIRRAIVEDEYGDATPVEVETVLTSCAFAPASSSENVATGQIAVVTKDRLFVPYDTTINADDEFEIDGKRYRIDGNPGPWRSPFTGWTPGTEVALERVTG
jgi:SPP1 family predicted phage head-tail adaptor